MKLFPSVILFVCLILTLGCSGTPGRITPPSVNAGSAAAEAMELYDLNQDGSIAGEEIEAAPALKAAMRQTDTNGDGQISESEISARIQAWEDSNIGLTSVQCNVEFNGRPLVGAEIEFEVEPYLANYIPSGKGKTNKYGRAKISIPKESRPATDTPAGMNFGLYRVRITKNENGKQIIPEKYNSETTIGQEISFQDRSFGSRIVYKLSGK